MAELIEMLFGGERDLVLDGVQIWTVRGSFEERHVAACCNVSPVSTLHCLTA